MHRAGKLILFVGLILVSLSCSSRVGFHPGTQCDLNTECGAPLVCRLGFCRLECRSQRDCGVGLTCVRDADGLGACQLPAETECTLDSDCPAPLVCRDRNCTNACEDDRDCVPGSVCSQDETGALGCRDDGESDCALNSDCPDALICAVDNHCRVQCRVSRDCAPERICADWMDPPRCVSADASRPDAGMDAMMDSTVMDSTVMDSTVMDSTVMDSGVADSTVMDSTVMDSGVADSTVMDSTVMDSGVDATVADTGVLDAGPADSGVATPGVAGTDLLVAGFAHNCGALAPNDLRCWGDNFNAQLGDGTSTARSAPVSVSLTGVLRLAAGNGHSCAATTTGLFCWGDNTFGQVGVGSSARKISTPTRVSGVGVVVDLAAGRDHMCALSAASVVCWGKNDRGQLGDGTTTNRNTPTAVLGLSSVPVALAARGTHTCALMADATLWCWGDNQFGQLGQGTSSSTPITRPTAVPALTGIVRVVAGTGFTCILNRTGKVVCWGDGSFGTLGDGTFGTRLSPGAPADLLDPVAEIAGGVRHVCALTTTNRLFCWGDNAASQLGRPAFTPASSATPLEITGIGTPLEVNAGQSHSCVRLAAGFRCWGANTFHQLGDGTATPSQTPVNVRWP